MANEIVVPGQFALRGLGISGIPIFNLENACASSSSALYLAHCHLSTGLAEVALVIGTEKLYTADEAARFAVFNQPLDLEQARLFLERYGDRLVGAPSAPQEGPRSVLMDSYSAAARMHMKRFGTTQRQLAAIASKNHAHSVHNPHSQYRKAMSVDEILAARGIAWPLTVPMCAPISDGSAAALLCTRDALRRFQAARPVRVRASVMLSGADRDPEDYARHVTRLAALKAYEHAGVGPEDIAIAEVHDASAFGEVMQTEALGLCEIGEGGRFGESGATTLGGRVPVNTSGGLVSKGHPLAATGLSQIHELVEQLRGAAGMRQVTGARIAVAQNGGGYIGVEEACACITVLERA